MTTLILYLVVTAFFIAVMVKQSGLIIYSPRGDKYLFTKVSFLIFNIGVVSTAWFLYLGNPQYAVIFYLISSVIGFSTYFIINEKGHP